MGDGAFDEGFLAHAERGVDRVEPLLVVAHTVAEISAWKETNVAADGCEGRVLL